MATKSASTAKAEEEKNESVYTIDELANGHKVLDASFEIVETALKLAGKKEATLKEAKKIVDEFKNREV